MTNSNEQHTAKNRKQSASGFVFEDLMRLSGPKGARELKSH
ncbi:hypothetical protein HMPREF9412_0347 [Paenibacillus sp. HGF5]|nr:hypothetical protein HMPREF9412_0347 [Paenibacillus sp. HGF5]